ncbi:MAG: hypothetical protein J6W64_01280 [Bacilli bacterium]|nr:hypothetical protein [Bacilli bacterium]
MRKITIKILSLIAALTLVLALASCGLFKSVTKEEAKSNLEAAGYKVTVVDGNTFADSDENEFNVFSSELDTYMYAVKGEDKIKMYFFVSTDIATRNADFMFNTDGLLSGQANELVYFGTRQAIKDAGL